MRPIRTTAGALAAALAACTPALDWREVRPADSDALVMFPCKPQRFARRLPLAGAHVEMRLASCTAQQATFAIGYATLADPRQVGPALDELRRAAAANIGATPVALPWSIAGMTPHPLAQKLVMRGRDAAGTPVDEQAVFFTRGLRVYQATVVGPSVDAAAAETFFGGLELLS
jgi:hypothetical protein